MPIKGWYGYLIDIKAEVQGQEIKAKDVVFSNGEVVSPELIDLKTNKSLKLLVQPDLTNNYYKDSHLIAGNKDAKNKIVVFSDPLCPFCIDYVPEVIKHVKNNPSEIALYYYHFPLLKIHPAAGVLTRLMDIAKEKGIKDIELKVYEIDWDPHFDAKVTDEKVILKAFNKELKVDISFDELSNKDITKKILKDIALGEDVMVKGTPTIFINGKKDNTKLKYETLGSK